MKPASILITDDESNIRLMVRTALEADGYAVSEASNGREAMAAIAQRVPDLMVLDLNMAVMDGMAVLEQMKTLASASRPRVVVLTAYGSISAAVKATRLGAMDFLEKPIKPGELRTAVRGVLEESDVDEQTNTITLPNEYSAVLERIRKSFRMSEFDNAEELLMKAAERRAQSTAEYFNLLGVLYEAQRKLRLAQKCYGKALDSDRQYKPAQLNMARIQQLRSYGQTARGAVLGDEADDVLEFQQPEPLG
jgi:DNA-binding response OmpR family regulator